MSHQFSYSAIAGSLLLLALLPNTGRGQYRETTEPRKTLFSWRTADEEPEEDEEEEEDSITTDRPDFTEASSTVGCGRLQFEFGYTVIHDDEGPSQHTAHSYPELLMRWGILAEWLELRVAFNYSDDALDDPLGAARFDGPEDLYLGFKIGLTEQEGILPEMALMPQMTVPTGTDDVSADAVLPGVNWLYAWDVNDFLSTGGSTQVNRSRDDLGGFYDEWAQSWTIGYGLTDRLGAYTEWFAFFPSGSNDPAVGAEHYFDGGFTYLVNNNFQLDIRAGVGLNERADDFFAGTGAAVRF